MASLGSEKIETPLGTILAIGDEQALYLLKFLDQKGLDADINLIQKNVSLSVEDTPSSTTRSIRAELSDYFAGKGPVFKTPIQTFGSPFQRLVWKQLQEISYGDTCSYSDLSLAINKPSAIRAAASANGRNPLCIIIPCHRVIQKDGGLGGYNGGLDRKRALLDLERGAK